MRRRQLSEQQLIDIIQETTRRRGRVRVGIGDDACVLAGGLVLTTDAYADRVHFDLRYMTWRQVGERCTCAAVSDVVAMAARPEVVLVALTLPKNVTRADVRALYSGIESVCAEMGCEVAGGDIIVADRLALALTAVGRTKRPALRSAAKPGDIVYVTGSLGAAEAGRLMLKKGRDRAPRWASPLVQRHLRPIPRLGAAARLRAAIHALIDTSDGLATDARHIAEMSRVRIDIDTAALPILPETRRYCWEQGLDPVGFVLSAGEDYELLFTSSQKLVPAVRGTRLAAIGRVRSGKGLFVVQNRRAVPLKASGFDHLAATRA